MNWGADCVALSSSNPESWEFPPGVICGESPSLWFWHLLIGAPDCAIGGGRYVQVMQIVQKSGRIRREIPVLREMLGRVESLQGDVGRPKAVRISCAEFIGFPPCFWRAKSKTSDGEMSL